MIVTKIYQKILLNYFYKWPLYIQILNECLRGNMKYSIFTNYSISLHIMHPNILLGVVNI